MGMNEQDGRVDRARRRPAPVTTDIGWCWNGGVEHGQCATCLRNRRRFTLPKSGLFAFHVLSEKQKALAAEGQCPVYLKDKVSARRLAEEHKAHDRLMAAIKRNENDARATVVQQIAKAIESGNAELADALKREVDGPWQRAWNAWEACESPAQQKQQTCDGCRWKKRGECYCPASMWMGGEVPACACEFYERF